MTGRRNQARRGTTSVCQEPRRGAWRWPIEKTLDPNQREILMRPCQPLESRGERARRTMRVAIMAGALGSIIGAGIVIGSVATVLSVINDDAPAEMRGTNMNMNLNTAPPPQTAQKSDP